MLVAKLMSYAPTLAEGDHRARLVGLYDVGVQVDTRYGEDRHQVIFEFEAVDCPRKDGKVNLVSRFFRNSMHERSAMRQALDEWVGPLGDDDARKGFPLVTLLGKACLISVEHAGEGDSAKARVVGVRRLRDGEEPPAARSPLVAHNFGEPISKEIPEWVQKIIAKGSNPDTPAARHEPDAAELSDDHADGVPF